MKIAFIGAGSMTCFHIQAFLDIEGVQLVGITSRTRSKAERFDLPVVTDTIPELYEKTKPDMVVICVHIGQTEAVLKQALAYPWKIMTEKPLGHDFMAAERLMTFIKSIGREADVFMALNRRFLSSTSFVLQNITTQKGPRIIKVQDRQSIQEALSYGHPNEVAENFMYGNSIHLIDYFQIFGRGDVVQVNNHIVKDRFRLTELAFESGDIGVYEAFWEVPGQWGVVVTCDKRRYELNPLEQVIWQNIGSHNKHYADVTQWDQNFKPGLRSQAAEATKMLHGQPHSLPSLIEAYKTTQIIRKIYET